MDKNNALPDQRPILSCGRTYRKQALISDPQGNVKDVIVGGVFSDLAYRGRGYASRLMVELASTLRDWQLKDGEICIGSTLYSVVGRRFYSQFGWKAPFKNTDFEFPAQLHQAHPDVTLLQANDLTELCKRDEAMVRKSMANPSDRTRLTIIPDIAQISWHHAKAEFVGRRLFGRPPHVKGVLVGGPGKQVFAIWTHRFASTVMLSEGSGKSSTKILQILRLVIEDQALSSSSSREDLMDAKLKLEAVLHAAQNEAVIWDMSKVILWNPPPLVEQLIECIGIEHHKEERENDSISSLLWYGDGDAEDIEWVGNEKYAAC